MEIDSTWLMRELLQSPVFGDSFDVDTAKAAVMAQQATVVGRGYIEAATRYCVEGAPDKSEKETRAAVSGLARLAVGCGPGLSAGELSDTARLTQLAVLIGLTGWANRLCDQHDKPTILATWQLCNEEVTVLPAQAEAVAARLRGLRHIEGLIGQIALPADVKYLLRASRDELMKGEVRAQAMTQRYLKTHDKDVFWAKYATEAAEIMSITAALPSAVTPLYAIYRQEDANLPSLAEVYDEQEILHFLYRVSNPFVRVFDDAGDQEVDASPDTFSLNLFNHPHPMLLRAFFAKALINDEHDIDRLTHAFAQNDVEQVTEFFLGHIRKHVDNLSPRIHEQYSTYIKLGKRATEAGFINRQAL